MLTCHSSCDENIEIKGGQHDSLNCTPERRKASLHLPLARMDQNARKAKQKMGNDRWDLIMGSVDSGTLDAQKMHDLAFGLGTKVGGNHKRRVGVERMKADRAEMARILGDWWEQDDDFDDLSEHDVTQKLITLFKNEDIGLKSLARALGKTLIDLRSCFTFFFNVVEYFYF